jgi:EAL domain-containing protein (putative c-di-GMP-specific phosphodiesterase class I)/FixJ family two-component response regulator
MSEQALRILVLEDHAFQRAVAVSLLQRLGCHEVFTAADGHEALVVLQAVGPVDIAVCDLSMEGMDGVQFLRQVSTSGLVGAVIISSSLSSDLRRAVRQMVGLSGLHMLGDAGKPLQPDSLRALIERYSPAIAAPAALGADAIEISDAQMATALEAGQLQVVFQPKFNLLNGDITGVEALSRWRHPTLGYVPPDRFVPVLERCGLLDDWLLAQLQQGLDVQKHARDAGRRLNMAFNLNASQLAHRNLTGRIKDTLDARRIGGAGLTFELTETGLLQSSATSLENLVRLRMLGCALSMDDFGAGYSSLRRLCQLPFNEIKLDGEFARSLLSEPRCRAAVTSTLALGDALGLSVVIEGIETQEQRLQLVALGCTQGQGYLCARPMTGEVLLRWLGNNQPSTMGAGL